jgi:hypothetical protein
MAKTFRKVENIDKHPAAAPKYVLVSVDGKKGLATPHEASRMVDRAKKNPEDFPNTLERVWEWLTSKTRGYE